MNGVSGWFWLGIPLKVTVKMSVEAVSSGKLNGATVPTSKMTQSHVVG